MCCSGRLLGRAPRRAEKCRPRASKTRLEPGPVHPRHPAARPHLLGLQPLDAGLGLLLPHQDERASELIEHERHAAGRSSKPANRQHKNWRAADRPRHGPRYRPGPGAKAGKLRTHRFGGRFGLWLARARSRGLAGLGRFAPPSPARRPRFRGGAPQNTLAPKWGAHRPWRESRRSHVPVPAVPAPGLANDRQGSFEPAGGALLPLPPRRPGGHAGPNPGRRQGFHGRCCGLPGGDRRVVSPSRRPSRVCFARALRARPRPGCPMRTRHPRSAGLSSCWHAVGPPATWKAAAARRSGSQARP